MVCIRGFIGYPGTPDERGLMSRYEEPVIAKLKQRGPVCSSGLSDLAAAFGRNLPVRAGRPTDQELAAQLGVRVPAFATSSGDDEPDEDSYTGLNPRVLGSSGRFPDEITWGSWGAPRRYLPL